MATPATAVILNPRAGRGRALQAWPHIEAILRAETAFEVYHSEKRGHAAQLALQARRNGYHRIISVGGDGTHHEVVNGLLEDETAPLTDTVLSIIPLGTASDLARSLGLPRNLPAAVRVALGDTCIQADVCRVDAQDAEGHPFTRHFMNVGHMGMGGVVAEKVEQGGKSRLGAMSYLWAVVSTLLAFRCPRVQLRIDDELFDQRIREVMVANGRYVGNGMLVAPRASMTSGRLETCIIGNTSLFTALTNVHRLYNGTLEDKTHYVAYRSARTVVAQSDDDVWLNLDGEPGGRLPARFTVVPGAVRLAVPATD